MAFRPRIELGLSKLRNRNITTDQHPVVMVDATLICHEMGNNFDRRHDFQN
jgi:hypothetical protein